MNIPGEDNAGSGAFPAEAEADAVVCGGGPGGSTFATLIVESEERP